MAVIRDPNGDLFPLLAHHLIGRSRSMQTTVRQPDVSSQHLSVAWDGERWLARDLASRNGTRIDGVALKPGENCVLSAGSVIELGTSAARLVLVDDGPPSVIVRSAAGARWGDDSMLALPSDEDPQVVLMQDPLLGWLCTVEEGEPRPIASGQTIVVGGIGWTVELPDEVKPTVSLRSLRQSSQGGSSLRLSLGVSADGEYVEPSLHLPQGVVSLPPRAHHAVLLELARRRLEDHEEPEAEQGWVYRDELRREVQMSNNQLYVSVYRLRKELSAHGLSAEECIEQRKPTRQIRLGIADVTIHQL